MREALLQSNIFLDYAHVSPSILRHESTNLEYLFGNLTAHGVKLMTGHNSRRFAPIRAKHRVGRHWMRQIYAFGSLGKIVSRVMDLRADVIALLMC